MKNEFKTFKEAADFKEYEKGRITMYCNNESIYLRSSDIVRNGDTFMVILNVDSFDRVVENLIIPKSFPDFDEVDIKEALSGLKPGDFEVLAILKDRYGRSERVGSPVALTHIFTDKNSQSARVFSFDGLEIGHMFSKEDVDEYKFCRIIP